MDTALGNLWILHFNINLASCLLWKGITKRMWRKRTQQNITSFYGKYIEIETIRNNDSLKRSTRSKKMHASACRTINLTTPMGLSFEDTREIGARGIEKNGVVGFFCPT